MEVVIPVGPPPMMIRSYIDEAATRDKPSLSANSSRSIHSYAMRCSPKNALARRQSGHQLAPMTVSLCG